MKMECARSLFCLLFEENFLNFTFVRRNSHFRFNLHKISSVVQIENVQGRTEEQPNILVDVEVMILPMYKKDELF